MAFLGGIFDNRYGKIDWLMSCRTRYYTSEVKLVAVERLAVKAVECNRSGKQRARGRRGYLFISSVSLG